MDEVRDLFIGIDHPDWLDHHLAAFRRCFARSPLILMVLYMIAVVSMVAPSFYHFTRYAILVLLPLIYNIAPMALRYHNLTRIEVLDEHIAITRARLLEQMERELRELIELEAKIAAEEAQNAAKQGSEVKVVDADD